MTDNASDLLTEIVYEILDDYIQQVKDLFISKEEATEFAIDLIGGNEAEMAKFKQRLSEIS